MRNTIFILLYALLFCSCIREGDVPCEGVMKLSFLHWDEVDFDTAVGNDVELHLYSEGALLTTMTVPYSQIRGGRSFEFRKVSSGQVDLVAWAVPSTEDPGLIPSWTTGESLENKTVSMKTIARSTFCQPMGSLFLGSIGFVDDMNKESSHEITMRNSICKLVVNVSQDSEYFTPGQKDPPRIEVYGSMSEMKLDYSPGGEEATVPAELIYNASQHILSTETIGLLPSSEGQNLSLIAFSGEKAVFRVDTDLRSIPGKEYVISIVRGSVTVEVDGWKSKATLTEM